MSWENVVMEVMQRKKNGQKTNLLNDESSVSYVKAAKQRESQKRVLAAYGLGSRYGDAYFTKREAECMIWLLKGKTINGVAKILGLSPRTVEYYIKNMKTKIGCRTKFELIDLVYASDFIKNVDFKL